MRLKLLAGAALAAMLATSGVYAQEAAGATDDSWAEHGWYGAIDLGAHDQQHMEAKATLEGGGNGLNFRSDGWDFTGFARLGYRFTPHVRVELEGGWRKGADNLSAKTLLPGSNPNSTDITLCGPATIPGGPCLSPNGHTRSITVMGNVIFDIMPSSRFDPFIGGGAGLNSVKSHFYGQLDVDGDPTLYTLGVSGTSNRFAYQGIGGVAFRATDRLNIDITYRYLSGLRDHFSSTTTYPQPFGTFLGTYNDNSVTIGVRYAFASPPPPPPPPTPPPTAPPPPPPPPPPLRRLRLRR